MKRCRSTIFLAGAALILIVAGGCGSTPETVPPEPPPLDAATILMRAETATPAQIEELDRDIDWILSRRQEGE